MEIREMAGRTAGKGHKMTRKEIEEIVAQMTVEEKASLCSGGDFWHTKAVERLGVPAMMVSDGPHGLRKQKDEGDHLGVNDSIVAVCYPAGCASASSFDRELLKKMGKAVGEACQAEGVGVILGPAVNIKRSPLREKSPQDLLKESRAGMWEPVLSILWQIIRRPEECLPIPG